MKEFVVILADIRSLHNVGSIFRTADAAGVSKIYLCGITPTPLNVFGRPEEKLAKVALGAEKNIPWEKNSSIIKTISSLKKDDFTILALEQAKKSVPYNKFHPKKTEKIALILGEETKGLTSSILKKCDRVLEIPMRGAMVRQAHHPKKIKEEKMIRQAHYKESLNVSVSFGIAAFELIRK